MFASSHQFESRRILQGVSHSPLRSRYLVEPSQQLLPLAPRGFFLKSERPTLSLSLRESYPGLTQDNTRLRAPALSLEPARPCPGPILPEVFRALFRPRLRKHPEGEVLLPSPILLAQHRSSRLLSH